MSGVVHMMAEQGQLGCQWPGPAASPQPGAAIVKGVEGQGSATRHPRGAHTGNITRTTARYHYPLSTIESMEGTLFQYLSRQ